MISKKHERFVAEYLIDYNGTRAAVAAGYSKHTARSMAVALLSNPNIAAEISRRSSEILARCEMSAEEVCLRLSRIARANIKDYVTWGPNGVVLIDSSQLTPEQAEAISEVAETVTNNGSTVKFKMFDKKGALDSLAKRHGLFAEKDPTPPAINLTIIDSYQLPEKPGDDPKMEVKQMQIPGRRELNP